MKITPCRPPPVIAFLQEPYEKFLRLQRVRDLSRALCQDRDLITSAKALNLRPRSESCETAARSLRPGSAARKKW